MEIALIVAFVVLLFLIVYYRLLLGELQSRNAGSPDRGGLLRVFTPPDREHLKPQHLKYYRRYWLSVVGLLLLVLGAALFRLPV